MSDKVGCGEKRRRREIGTFRTFNGKKNKKSNGHFHLLLLLVAAETPRSQLSAGVPQCGNRSPPPLLLTSFFIIFFLYHDLFLEILPAHDGLMARLVGIPRYDQMEVEVLFEVVRAQYAAEGLLIIDVPVAL